MYTSPSPHEIIIKKKAKYTSWLNQVVDTSLLCLSKKKKKLGIGRHKTVSDSVMELFAFLFLERINITWCVHITPRRLVILHYVSLIFIYNLKGLFGLQPHPADTKKKKMTHQFFSWCHQRKYFLESHTQEEIDDDGFVSFIKIRRQCQWIYGLWFNSTRKVFLLLS
jgi:hypothetical protein